MKKNFLSRVCRLFLVLVLILINAAFFQISASALSMVYMDSSYPNWIANLADSTNVNIGGWKNNSSLGGSSQIGTFDSNGKSIRIISPPNGIGRVNFWVEGLPNTDTVTYMDMRSEEFVFRINSGTTSNASVSCLGFKFIWDMSERKWKLTMNGLKNANGYNWYNKVAALLEPDVVHTLRFVQKDTSGGTVFTITDIFVDGVRITAAIDGTIFPAGGQPSADNFMRKYSSTPTLAGVYNGSNENGTSDIIFDLYSYSYYGLPELMNVTASTPIMNESSFPLDGIVSVTFDSDIDTETLTESSVSIAPANNPTQLLSYTGGAYDSAAKTYSIDLASTPLSNKTNYILKVSTSVKSNDGKVLLAPYIVNFSTAINCTYISSNSTDSIENAPIGNLIKGGYNGGWRNLSINTSTYTAVTYNTFDSDGKACRITTKPGDVGKLYYLSIGLPKPPIVTYTPIRCVEWQFKIGEGYYDGTANSIVENNAFKFLWDDETKTWLLKFNSLYNPAWQNRVMARITPNVKYSLRIIQKDESKTAWTMLGLYLNGKRLAFADDGTALPEEGLATRYNQMETGENSTWGVTSCTNPVTSTKDLIYDIYTLQYYGIIPMNVTSITPADGQNDVALNGTMTVTFDTDIDTNTLTADNISITPLNKPAQRLSYIGGTYNPDTKTYSIDLSAAPLRASTKYKLTVSRSVESVGGHTLIEDKIVDFSSKTGAAVEVHYFQNNQEITAIQPGIIECQAALNSNVDGQPVVVIAALYKQSDNQVEMVDTATINSVISTSGSVIAKPSLTVPAIEQGEQYFIKLLVWDNFDNGGMISTIKTFSNND